MTIETLTETVLRFGSLLIFILLFFGIVGIPSPEESLTFLIGVLIAEHQLSAVPSAAAAVAGAWAGMLAAYAGGRFIGYPLLHRIGRFIGLTEARWAKAERSFARRRKRAVLFGIFMPGIRQLSPYFAGIIKMRFGEFALLGGAASAVWVLPFIAAGYFLGRVFHVNPSYAALVGVAFLVLMIGWFIYKKVKPETGNPKR